MDPLKSIFFRFVLFAFIVRVWVQEVEPLSIVAFRPLDGKVRIQKEDIPYC